MRAMPRFGHGNLTGTNAGFIFDARSVQNTGADFWL
jgi:hypothetical protein